MNRLLRSREHHLRTEMFVPLQIDEVFAFFADASNLERITPKGLGFSILTPRPLEMKKGTEIRYRLKLFGLPIPAFCRKLPTCTKEFGIRMTLRALFRIQ